MTKQTKMLNQAMMTITKKSRPCQLKNKITRAMRRLPKKLNNLVKFPKIKINL